MEKTILNFSNRKLSGLIPNQNYAKFVYEHKSATSFEVKLVSW